MLYKVHMQEAFRDWPDRVGVIEASSLDEALARLRETVDSDWPDPSVPAAETWADPTSLKDSRRTQGTLTYRSVDEDGDAGVDVFAVHEAESPVFLFLLDDGALPFK